jgi:hypothetical protein
MRTSRIKKVAAVGALGALAACSSGGGGGAGGTYDQPLYAMMLQVYDDSGDRTVYVSLSDTLGVSSVSLAEAREFPGVANLASIGGKLLISDGNEPKITEFDVTDAHEWREGRSVSFGEYPLDDNANFYYQFIVNEHKALLPFAGTKRVVWDPGAMKIIGALEDTTLVGKEDPLVLEAGGNRNGVRYDSSIVQAFFYHDEDWSTYGKGSHLVVYDADTQKEKKVIDVPCPGLSLATRDEAGATYFGTWDISVATLAGKAPATCLAKVSPTFELEGTTDLRDWTGGRFVNNFRYVGGGKAFGNVLHHEELGVTSPAQLDDKALGDLWMSGPHWRLWLFDVEKKTGKPVEGVDVALSSGAQMAELDGRTFLFVPYDDWGRTKAYELDADGKATPRFDTVGDVFKWVRVR